MCFAFYSSSSFDAVECVRVAIFPFFHLANWFIEEMEERKTESCIETSTSTRNKDLKRITRKSVGDRFAQQRTFFLDFLFARYRLLHENNLH